MTPATAGTGGIRCLASHCAWRARRTRAACWRSTRLMWSIPPPAGNTRRRLWRNFPDGCGSIWTRAFPGCLRRRTARYWAMPTPVASPHAGATTGTPRSQYTCLPPHTGGTPPPRPPPPGPPGGPRAPLSREARRPRAPRRHRAVHRIAGSAAQAGLRQLLCAHHTPQPGQRRLPRADGLCRSRAPAPRGLQGRPVAGSFLLSAHVAAASCRARAACAAERAGRRRNGTITARRGSPVPSRAGGALNGI